MNTPPTAEELRHRLMLECLLTELVMHTWPFGKVEQVSDWACADALKDYAVFDPRFNQEGMVRSPENGFMFSGLRGYPALALFTGWTPAQCKHLLYEMETLTMALDWVRTRNLRLETTQPITQKRWYIDYPRKMEDVISK